MLVHGHSICSHYAYGIALRHGLHKYSVLLCTTYGIPLVLRPLSSVKRGRKSAYRQGPSTEVISDLNHVLRTKVGPDPPLFSLSPVLWDTTTTAQGMDRRTLFWVGPAEFTPASVC